MELPSTRAVIEAGIRFHFRGNPRVVLKTDTVTRKDRQGYDVLVPCVTVYHHRQHRRRFNHKRFHNHSRVALPAGLLVCFKTVSHDYLRKHGRTY